MSTAVSVSIVAAKTASFIRIFKLTSSITALCHDGIVYLQVRKGDGNSFCATLAVGETEHDDVQFSVDANKLLKFLQSAKKGTVTLDILTSDKSRQLSVSSDNGTANFDSERFMATSDPFAYIGDHLDTVSLDEISSANSITNRCDPDSTRYALGAVAFDGGFIIATDGRRLVSLATSGNYAPLIVIDRRVVKFAAKYCHDVDVFAPKSNPIGCKFLLAGELVVEFAEGRYPNWRQVCELGKDTESIRVNCDNWRKNVELHLAMYKSGQAETHGFEFPLVDGNGARLDVRFVKDAIGKLSSVQARFKPEYNKENLLTAPIELTSDERIGWREIIMPMARDR